ncbi:MAG TPA: hypothetical protein VJY85_01535, partial [Candidatus Limnocylindria bacterium]|nr:hypothetical protein [Candidatus Limnocylindria bacterium]
ATGVCALGIPFAVFLVSFIIERRQASKDAPTLRLTAKAMSIVCSVTNSRPAWPWAMTSLAATVVPSHGRLEVA